DHEHLIEVPAHPRSLAAMRSARCVVERPQSRTLAWRGSFSLTVRSENSIVGLTRRSSDRNTTRGRVCRGRPTNQRPIVRDHAPSETPTRPKPTAGAKQPDSLPRAELARLRLGV